MITQRMHRSPGQLSMSWMHRCIVMIPTMIEMILKVQSSLRLVDPTASIRLRTVRQHHSCLLWLARTDDTLLARTARMAMALAHRCDVSYRDEHDASYRDRRDASHSHHPTSANTSRTV